MSDYQARYAKKRWAAMPYEERHAANQKKYETYKDWYKEQSERWRKENPEFSRISSQHSQVKKRYPRALTLDTPEAKDIFGFYLDHQGQPCRYCSQPSHSVDHVIPLGAGGLHELKNLQLICWNCNKSKGNKTDEEYITWLGKVKK